MIAIKTTGVKELRDMFNKLEKKEASAVARKSVREANKKHMLPEVKTRAESVVGGEMGTAISNAMTVQVMAKMRKANYGSKVVIKPTDAFVHMTSDNKRYYIPNAIEYGHAFAGRGGGSSAPKDVAPRPFMRPAYEAKRKITEIECAKMMDDGIQDAVKRNAKKG